MAVVRRATCALGAVAIWLHLLACDNPVSSDTGPFGLAVVVVTEDDYGGDRGAELKVDFSGGIIVWESPIDHVDITGVYVELQNGSQATDLAFVPVLSWLRSRGDADPGPIALTRRDRHVAKGLRIDDPGHHLVGRTLAVSSPLPGLRARKIETMEFTVSRDDYIELQWPVFTSAVELRSADIRMATHWQGDVLERRGTYVGAWVKGIDGSGTDEMVPVDDWLFQSEAYSPSDLYVSEIGFFPKYRDRSLGLLGKTIVVAFVVTE